MAIEMLWFQIPVWIIVVFLSIVAVSFVGRLIGWMHVAWEDITDLVDKLNHSLRSWARRWR